MSTLNPSPLPDASPSTRGAVSTGTQSFSGIKTFVNAVVLSAGLQLNGVLAAATNYLAKFEATSTGLPTNGATKIHFGHGNRPSQLVSTIGLFNSLGRGMAFAASSGIARLTFDDAGPFYFSTADRALLETGDYLSSATVRFFIDAGTNRVATGIGTSLQTIDANTWDVTQRGAVTALTSSSGSIAINLAATNNYSHTLTENTTLAAPTNPVAGQSGCIVFTQHASSPKTLAFNSFWKFAGGTVPTLTATNSAVDVLTYYVCSSGFAVCQLIKGVA